jgi:hypothetical protein
VFEKIEAKKLLEENQIITFFGLNFTCGANFSYILTLRDDES